jgi:O-antigen ligase
MAPPGRPTAPPLARDGATPMAHRVAYGLFILVNATLFIRPAEIAPQIESLPSYEVLIIACLLFGLPSVYPQLAPRSLAQRPVTLCGLALMVAVICSHLFSPSHGFFIWGARMSAYKYFKILVYFLLLVSLVDTPARLRRFVLWLGTFIILLTTITLLQANHVLDIPTIDVFYMQDERDADENLIGVTPRLQSTGIFNDPNDFCLILVVGMGISGLGLTTPRWRVYWPVWLTALVGCGYALYLTRSRGGFIAMLAGLLIAFHARFGWFKSALLSVVVLPAIFMLFAGRATELSTGASTAQSRLQLWSEALELFRSAPLFGIGEGEYVEVSEDHMVAHNSYLHAFAELGFFGGTIFLGGFYYAFWMLQRLGNQRLYFVNPEVKALRPFMVTLVGGYAAGLLSLSRIMVVPTYMILALGGAYLQMAYTYPPLTKTRFSAKLVLRLVLVSVVFLLLMYLYVRSNVRWG